MGIFATSSFDDLFSTPCKSSNCDLFSDGLFAPIKKVKQAIPKPTQPKSLAGRISQAVNVKSFDEKAAVATHKVATDVFISSNHVKTPGKTSITVLEPADDSISEAYVIHTHQNIGIGGFNVINHATLVEKRGKDWDVTKVALRKNHTEGSTLTLSQLQEKLEGLDTKYLDAPLYVFTPDGKDKEYGLTQLADGDMEESFKSKTPTQLLRMARDAAQGLKTLHETDLIHRDLKPANILVYGDSAKLSDLDDLIKPDGALHEHIGTPGYLAPELISAQERHGDKLYSIHSKETDVFAFGVMLMEISHKFITDEDYKPYLLDEKAKGVQGFFVISEMMEDLVYEDMDDATVVKALRTLAKQCVHSDPSKRPSATEVAISLSTFA